MTFSVPIVEIYHKFFIRNPSDIPNYVAYVEPLTWITWAAVFVLVAVAPLFLYVVMR